jgi:hypothetical protein
MLAADEDEGRARRPKTAAVTPAERAAAARLVAADEFLGPLVCRACAIEVVARLVLVAVEAAERDLRATIQEQMQWPN